DVFALIAQSTSVPIYGMSAPIVGRGIVGGHIITAEATGTRTAQIAMRILNGARAQDIPVESAPTVPMFDWHQLQRWGISENKLPRGTVVRFRELTFWEQYKGRVIAVLALCAIQALLIMGLLLQRMQRAQAKEALRESEERFRGMADTAPVLIWVSGV